MKLSITFNSLVINQDIIIVSQDSSHSMNQDLLLTINRMYPPYSNRISINRIPGCIYVSTTHLTQLPSTQTPLPGFYGLPPTLGQLTSALLVHQPLLRTLVTQVPTLNYQHVAELKLLAKWIHFTYFLGLSFREYTYTLHASTVFTLKNSA